MNLSIEQREVLQRWLPLILVIGGVWLLARGIRNLFWTVFGLTWAFVWSGGWLLFWR